MQSIQLQIEDTLYNTLVSRKINIQDKINKFLSNLTMDENLKLDPFFYERQKDLHKLLEDVESGKMKMYDFDDSMDELLEELQA